MLWLLIKLYFSALLTVSAITYLLFWYEEGSRPYGPHPGVCTRATCILRGLIMSFFSMLFVTISYPLGFVPDRLMFGKRGTASPENPPILLVHGLYHNASAWLAYRRWFKQAGFTNSHAFTYFSFFTRFETLLSKLEEEVAALEKRHPSTKPILVGHSLGGLLIRAWLSEGDNEQRVAGVITLGTPHQGSKLAGLGAGALSRSLIFRGPLIRTIEANDIAPSIPCYSLSSALDNMVLPQEGLHIRNASWIEERAPQVSHIAMLFHKGTALQAINALCAIVDEQTEPRDILPDMGTIEDTPATTHPDDE
ncbi:alpha/beta fold hydrolase [Desulfovibrio mangrovi]|uniref:esterase/lipase family protein n=1 Tax=Desulfovibrio mangrovi TaxID=2976983 RepID=UPI0022473BAF|nr:alpha/beta fold hydrolase [Desulfovibrio mangrovi]UZP68412.1 alpha/beta fold hydrolase [Desulfovibrio mangrovi]